MRHKLLVIVPVCVSVLLVILFFWYRELWQR